MRRWNGWGDESETARLGEGSRAFLENRLGPGSPPRVATFAEVIASVPPSRLEGPDERLDIDPETRVRHAHGQSFPDLIALRSGRLGAVPDAVAMPATATDVRAVIDVARERGARLVPYGGGTSVVGGVTVLPSSDPVISVDLARLAGVSGLDERSGLVTCGAGTTGRRLRRISNPSGSRSVTSRSPTSLPPWAAGWRRAGRACAASAAGGSSSSTPAAGSRPPPARWTCRPSRPRPPARTCASSCSDRRAAWASSPT